MGRYVLTYGAQKPQIFSPNGITKLTEIPTKDPDNSSAEINLRGAESAYDESKASKLSAPGTR